MVMQSLIASSLHMAATAGPRAGGVRRCGGAAAGALWRPTLPTPIPKPTRQWRVGFGIGASAGPSSEYSSSPAKARKRCVTTSAGDNDMRTGPSTLLVIVQRILPKLRSCSNSLVLDSAGPVLTVFLLFFDASQGERWPSCPTLVPPSTNSVRPCFRVLSFPIWPHRTGNHPVNGHRRRAQACGLCVCVMQPGGQ